VSRRASNEGALYKREKDGLWVGVLDLGWGTGERKRRYVYGRTQKEAASKLAELRRRQGLGLKIERDSQTVKQFLTRWLEWKKNHVRPRTYDGYVVYLERHAIKDLGDIRLVKLSVDQVQKMLDAKARRCSLAASRPFETSCATP